MGRRKKTTEEFITEARAVHGGKYNYGKTVYKGALKDIVITCPVHGDFPQRATSHLNGSGCPDCAREKIARAKTKTTEEFIRDAKAVHGYKYSYDNVVYVNAKTEVLITCPKHGEFAMLPDNHKDGHGCPSCAREKIKSTLTDSKEDFIAKAKVVHGNKYNYDKVEYVNDKTPVTITCSIHGDFPQKPCKHKIGQGCPQCNQSHLEVQTRILLEKNNIVFEPQKTFSWLKNKREMPLDFYLPEYNIAIECQGIHHYLTKGNGYFKDEDIHMTQQNDVLKYNLCKEQGIPIYYIKYDENIKEKLDEIIHNCKI